MKLYRSLKDLNRWFAFSRETGWVTFPAEIAGWLKRESAPDAKRNDMRPVPLHMGFNTGIPGAPAQTGWDDDASSRRFHPRAKRSSRATVASERPTYRAVAQG